MIDVVLTELHNVAQTEIRKYLFAGFEELSQANVIVLVVIGQGRPFHPLRAVFPKVVVQHTVSENKRQHVCTEVQYFHNQIENDFQFLSRCCVDFVNKVTMHDVICVWVGLAYCFLQTKHIFIDLQVNEVWDVKKYTEKDNIIGKPLVLQIEDFLELIATRAWCGHAGYQFAASRNA